MRKWFTRRRALQALGVSAGALVGARLLAPRLMRAGPVRPLESLSDEAQALAGLALAGLDTDKIWDLHVHLVGIGTGGSGCWVHPRMQSHMHPVSRLQFDVYMAASGIRDRERADQEYAQRLVELARATPAPAKHVLLAFDQAHTAEGEPDPDASPMHTPDAYARAVAARAPELLAGASVHPHRPDALEALEDAARAGAVLIKWLPNAMGIDPAEARHDAYYAKLAELGLPLLTHAGLERAVHAAEAQRLGNPLRLRRALDHGVTVIAAHCASLGEGEDLDQDVDARASLGNLELFLRLMGEAQYAETLFGDLSATTLVNRAPDVLRELLAATELHPRLLYGSDYPLPAIDPIVSPRQLAWRGVLESAERAPLEELLGANPLLGSFVLVRRLRLERAGGNLRFPAAVFETARVLSRA